MKKNRKLPFITLILLFIPVIMLNSCFDGDGSDAAKTTPCVDNKIIVKLKNSSNVKMSIYSHTSKDFNKAEAAELVTDILPEKEHTILNKPDFEDKYFTAVKTATSTSTNEINLTTKFKPVFQECHQNTLHILDQAFIVTTEHLPEEQSKP